MKIWLRESPSKILTYIMKRGYLIVKFAAIEEVEDLHHHERVEDKGEVAAIRVVGVVDVGVIVSASDVVEAAAPDGAAHHHTVIVLRLEVAADHSIKSIGKFGNEMLAPEDERYHDSKLEDRLTYDMLEHLLGDDVLIAAVWHPIQELFGGWFSSEGQRRQRIHNQVDPQHLDGPQHILLNYGSANECDNHGHDVDCQLKLYELLDGVVDVAAPNNRLYD